MDATGGTYWRYPGWPNPIWLTSNSSMLGQNFTNFKVGEMMAPSIRPARMYAGSGLGHITIPAHEGMAAFGQNVGTAISGPTFYDPATSRIITSAVCGTAYGFTVPGKEGSQIYLIQKQNGNPQFSGAFTVPMPGYTSICPQDEGTYDTSAYDITTGASLGTTRFQVLPPGSPAPTQGAPISVPGGTTGTGSALLGSLTSTELLIGAAALWFFLRRKKHAR